MPEQNVRKREWWMEAVVYQIYPKSFYDSSGDGIGDIKGIIEKLDYIKELGADTIWLCPINKSPNYDNGYDVSDYYHIMDDFGTLADFKHLVEEMHKMGLKLIMDMVVNHSSDEHPWFIESQKSRGNYYRDFYYWKDGKNGAEPNSWQSFFAGPAWKYDPKTSQYYLHLFSEKQPDLNWENPKLREEIHKMMKYWLDMGVDGFRLDAINLIGKQLDESGSEKDSVQRMNDMFTNRPEVHEYLREINRNVMQGYDAMTVGETGGITVAQAIEYSSEESKELSMVFHFEHMGLDIADSREWTSRPVDIAEFKRIMSTWQTGLEKEAWNALYLGNHDQTRIVSRFGNDKEYRTESAELLGTLILTLKGTPYIYQGDEIGMTNLNSTDIKDYDDKGTIAVYNELKKSGLSEKEIMQRIAKRSRDNSRTPMQWNAGANAGFTSGTPWMKVNDNYKEVNVDDSIKNEDSVLNYYKELIHLRRKHKDVLVYGIYEDIDAKNEEVYCYTREFADKKILVILNFSKDINAAEIPENIKTGKAEILLSNYKKQELKHNIIMLQPYEAMILSVF